jgi:hypothetical protein
MKLNEETITAMLLDLGRQKFFGSIELKLEAGRLILMRKTETFVNDSRENRDQNDYNRR